MTAPAPTPSARVDAIRAGLDARSDERAFDTLRDFLDERCNGLPDCTCPHHALTVAVMGRDSYRADLAYLLAERDALVRLLERVAETREAYSAAVERIHNPKASLVECFDATHIAQREHSDALAAVADWHRARTGGTET